MSLEASEDKPQRTRAQQRRDKLVEAHVDGMVVYFGDNRTLQLDLDSEEALTRAKDLLRRLKHIICWTSVRQTMSQGGNAHLYVTLKDPIQRRERMLLQGCLGSDPVREILNWDTAIIETMHASPTEAECFLLEVPGRAGRILKLGDPPKRLEDEWTSEYPGE